MLIDHNKPWRALPPDHQAYDAVIIRTVPRYKTSGLSGNEWRISAKILFYRKGILIAEKVCRDVETAMRYGDWWSTEIGENGGFTLARRDFEALCDQEGCEAVATVTYQIKTLYSREGYQQVPHRPMIRCFCDRHRTRGDCALEDSDRNYQEVTVRPDGTLDPVPPKE